MIFSFMKFLLNHLSFIMFLQGWIQHDLVGGGGVLCQLWRRVVSVMSAARPSTCFTTSLAWLQYLNCNCCSQFAYHHIRTYGKEKIRGRKEICPTFSDCAELSKKFSAETFQNCCRRGGGIITKNFYYIAYFPQNWQNFPQNWQILSHLFL
jgi:hypothetical protein